jgi:PAS domain S-box-containing protein
MNDTVLLLHNADGQADSLDPMMLAISGAGFEIYLSSEQAKPNEVFDSLPKDSRLVAVLISPEVHEPLRWARYAHRRAPRVPVFFLTGVKAARPFDPQGAPMPMLREYWTVTDTDPDRLIPMLRNSVKSMNQVQRFRTTLDRINMQLSDRDPIDSPNFRKLVASQQYLAEILDQSKDAIISMDPQGNIRSWNQAAEQMFAVTANVAIGQPIETMATADWPQQIATLLREVQSNGSPKIVEIACSRRDEQKLFVELAMSFVRDWHNQPIGISATVRDISERKLAEQARERLVAELELKNANLEQFNSTVAHDLKSPLITIRGFLRLLETEIVNQDMGQAQTRIDRISKAADHLGQLLDELLKLSRVDRPIPVGKPTSLTEVAHNAVNLLALQISNGNVEVVVDELPEMSVAPVKMQEVFQNLIENALRFVHDQPHPRVEIGVRKTETEQILYVRDNGIGIEPQYHEKVFEPFEQLNPGDGGTGIGLAIVKRVIEFYHGRIWIESEGTGDGATFCFTIHGADG